MSFHLIYHAQRILAFAEVPCGFDFLRRVEAHRQHARRNDPRIGHAFDLGIEGKYVRGRAVRRVGQRLPGRQGLSHALLHQVPPRPRGAPRLHFQLLCVAALRAGRRRRPRHYHHSRAAAGVQHDDHRRHAGAEADAQPRLPAPYDGERLPSPKFVLHTLAYATGPWKSQRRMRRTAEHSHGGL